MDSPGPMRLVDSAGSWEASRSRPVAGACASGRSLQVHSKVSSSSLPRETENTVYGYLTAISKLRLGILTEQGEGS